MRRRAINIVGIIVTRNAVRFGSWYALSYMCGTWGVYLVGTLCNYFIEKIEVGMFVTFTYNFTINFKCFY